jgi:membrane protein insertase Oxa1/YidC/SpoIIIJ
MKDKIERYLRKMERLDSILLFSNKKISPRKVRKIEEKIKEIKEKIKEIKSLSL